METFFGKADSIAKYHQRKLLLAQLPFIREALCLKEHIQGNVKLVTMTMSDPLMEARIAGRKLNLESFLS